MSVTAILAVSLALAFLTESMVEYVFGTIADHVEKLKPYKWTLIYVALLVGVGLSWYYQLDLIALVAEQEPGQVGYIMTGLIVGRGANYLHDFVSAYLLKPKN